MTQEEIKKDILAFADDDSDVLFESNGDVMYYKNGTEQICRIISNEEGNRIVEFQGENFPYRTFIARKLANLDLFARKIIEKRKKVDAFVDSPAELKTVHKEEKETALILLQRECDNFLEFGSKINFITADAGHGKSALLKQYQHLQAERYLQNKSPYLFWHVDLQGRDLVRLPEAIMYDLGELRLPGLYYPSVINLIQKRFIILAIDGFDELAAEIGGMNAVSSLSSFVNEMEGQGTLIAASRRTFFDTHDYLKRTSLLKNKVPFDINFNELKLKDWTKKEVIEYFDNLEFQDSDNLYERILIELHEASHPILTRPFLITKLAGAIEGNADLISSLFSKSGNPNEGVSIIVEAFTKREVDKWKERDNQTGKPYLSYEQHIQFLAVIAKEMWEAGRDYVTLEEIELYTVMLLEEWSIDESIRAIILRMVRTHAFLIPIAESKFELRKFDHEEFKNFFLSRSLADLINRTILNGNYKDLKRFLYANQLPDSVAMYCFNYVNELNSNIEVIIKIFKAMIDEEYKPTYLQMNIGTIFPFMIDKIDFEKPLIFDAKVTYASLAFENKTLRNIIFQNGNFINISLRDTVLKNVHFSKCTFNEIKIDESSSTCFSEVSFDSTKEINSLVLLNDGDVKEIAYSPNRIKEILIQNGVNFVEDDSKLELQTIKVDSDFKKSLNKFILKFNKMTIQYEKSIVEDKYLGSNTNLIIDEIIPLLYENNIIEMVDNNQTRQANSKAWRLKVPIEDILKYDGELTSNPYSTFWKIVNDKNS